MSKKQIFSTLFASSLLIGLMLTLAGCSNLCEWIGCCTKQVCQQSEVSIPTAKPEEPKTTATEPTDEPPMPDEVEEKTAEPKSIPVPMPAPVAAHPKSTPIAPKAIPAPKLIPIKAAIPAIPAAPKALAPKAAATKGLKAPKRTAIPLKPKTVAPKALPKALAPKAIEPKALPKALAPKALPKMVEPKAA